MSVVVSERPSKTLNDLRTFKEFKDRFFNTDIKKGHVNLSGKKADSSVRSLKASEVLEKSKNCNPCNEDNKKDIETCLKSLKTDYR